MVDWLGYEASHKRSLCMTKLASAMRDTILGRGPIRRSSSRGTYSIYYSRRNNPDEFALDWAFTLTDGTSQNDGRPAERKWFTSIRDYGCARWFKHTENDEKMHEVLLDHFGLSDWKDEYPPEKLIRMSPDALAYERRKKEKEHPSLTKLTMYSDTVGFRISADKYRE